jgi:hypothetical protein
LSSTNRLQLGIVRETTAGTTPGTPRMRAMRVTGEQLTYTPTYVDSDEIRPDRMNAAPILVMSEPAGSIPFQLTYPKDESPLSEIYRSALFNAWTNTAQRDNDGTADSNITAVATTNEILTTLTGTSFIAGQLVRFTGFGVAGNNGVFKCTTGSATVARFIGAGLTDEAVPPAAARVKVVGFAGAAADITATATGLGSTLLDFTTLGLAVGQWVKVGGTAAGDKFATAALNAYMRITAIAATALTLDNRPVGWTTDAGTGKTIKVWVGDTIKNGTTVTSLSIEAGLLGQTVPVYRVFTGMEVDTLSHTIASRAKITCSAAFKGMGGSESTTVLDASYDAVTTGLDMAANANVGRIADNGSVIAAGNWAKDLDFTINNNLRTVESADTATPVAIREGECTVTGKINTYFGDDTLLAKFYAGTPTSINTRITKSSLVGTTTLSAQTLIYSFPTVTYRGGGQPNATGKNTDAMLSLDFTASYDSTYGATVMIDRMEYVE